MYWVAFRIGPQATCETRLWLATSTGLFRSVDACLRPLTVRRDTAAVAVRPTSATHDNGAQGGPAWASINLPSQAPRAVTRRGKHTPRQGPESARRVTVSAAHIHPSLSIASSCSTANNKTAEQTDTRRRTMPSRRWWRLAVSYRVATLLSLGRRQWTTPGGKPPIRQHLSL